MKLAEEKTCKGQVYSVGSLLAQLMGWSILPLEQVQKERSESLTLTKLFWGSVEIDGKWYGEVQRTTGRERLLGEPVL